MHFNVTFVIIIEIVNFYKLYIVIHCYTALELECIFPLIKEQLELICLKQCTELQTPKFILP